MFMFFPVLIGTSQIRPLAVTYLLPLLLLLLPHLVWADTGGLDADKDAQLAKKSQNPISKTINLPFEYEHNLQYGPFHRPEYELRAKPITLFTLNKNWDLYLRTIIPLMNVPSTTMPNVYNAGPGDINPNFYFSPTPVSDFHWGLGPGFMIPTATNPNLGAGKWSIGPAAVVVYSPRQWVIGFLASNLWSVGGVKSRPSYNQLSFQYFINYNFKHGWYLATSSTNLANWGENSSNRWTVPLGGGIGRAFHIGKQGFDCSFQTYYNIKRPHTGNEVWSLQLSFSLLFPQ
ncbi:MAG: transporter [Gammaproteobacteria bacterium]|nr:transporter [Gammaproteobacteria bacterium]